MIKISNGEKNSFYSGIQLVMEFTLVLIDLPVRIFQVALVARLWELVGGGGGREAWQCNVYELCRC